MIQPWLHYIFVELLKNSMAVTVERAGNVYQQALQTTHTVHENHTNDNHNDNHNHDEEESSNRPLYVTITIPEEDPNLLHISIHDQGGGICQAKKQKLAQDTRGQSPLKAIFEFAQCRRKWDRLQDQQSYAMTRSPLQGLGVGLSMSRMMMRQFGGDLTLQERCSPSILDPYGRGQKIPLDKGVTATLVLNTSMETPEEWIKDGNVFGKKEIQELESCLT